MVVVLGDLLADYNLGISNASVALNMLHRADYLELGPGGACNVAITAARLGLDVRCLGEVGDDIFGNIVLDSLGWEGIDTSAVFVTAGARTPVATVFVDDRGEPTYLGYPGSLQLDSIEEEWQPMIASAEAIFIDGWASHAGGPKMRIEAVFTASKAGVPIFFDPGPGNAVWSNDWQARAAERATVIMATEEETQRLTGLDDPVSSARALLFGNTQLVIIKRGAAGCILIAKGEVVKAPGFPVELQDATGAGDSFAAAVIYAYLRGLPLAEIGAVANATGAAKVTKLGTGLNMPTAAEVRAILERFDHPVANVF